MAKIRCGVKSDILKRAAKIDENFGWSENTDIYKRAVQKRTKFKFGKKRHHENYPYVGDHFFHCAFSLLGTFFNCAFILLEISTFGFNRPPFE